MIDVIIYSSTGTKPSIMWSLEAAFTQLVLQSCKWTYVCLCRGTGEDEEWEERKESESAARSVDVADLLHTSTVPVRVPPSAIHTSQQTSPVNT